VSDLEARLRPWLASLLGVTAGTLELRDLQRLSGGASRVTWSLMAGDRPLIVQMGRPGGLSGSFAGEAVLLRAADAAGVPVATVLGATDDPEVLGTSAIAMEFLEGEAVARPILRDAAFAGARTELVGQLARAAASIHALDPEDFAYLRDDDPVHLLRGLHQSLGWAHPVFDLAFRWLDAHRPEPPAPSVVHGDLRLGNLLVDEGGLVAVLDWELAHLGDPAEDLMWACVKAWRFGQAAPVMGMGSVQDLLAAYVAAGGSPMAPERLRWWLVLGTLRWGVICEVQVSQHLRGAGSLELAAIGRRVCETEHDLLDLLGLLDLAPSDSVAPASRAASVHDVPDAIELVAAVRAWLVGDVVDSDGPPRTRFSARVAANVLGIVERELAERPASGAEHQLRLASIGFADDVGLAAAIAAGAFDDRRAELAMVLVPSVVAKVRVANPTYLETPRADPWTPVATDVPAPG